MPPPCDPTPHTKHADASAALAVALALLVASLIARAQRVRQLHHAEVRRLAERERDRDLYKIVLYIAGVVFVIVEGALAYSVYKFRAKKNAVAAQIHGNTRLEIGWTVAAALILVVLTVVTFVKLPSIINPPNSDANGLGSRLRRPRRTRRTARST